MPEVKFCPLKMQDDESRSNRDLMRDIIDVLECGIEMIATRNEVGEEDHGFGGPRLFDKDKTAP
jgi:hypothetical protein